MNFKEQLQEELEIFLNIEEFGETFTLDSVEYVGVIEQPNSEVPKEEYEGVIREVDFIVYTKYKESLEKYTSGKQVWLNKRLLVVHRAYEEQGLFVMELAERNRF